jgi:hypothetical protein
MNTSGRSYTKAAAVVAGLLALLPMHASACAVCMGSDSNVGEAINGAIFLMLGFIGTMLAGLAGFAFYLMKRANAPLSPHLGVAQIANDLEGQS